LAVAGLTPAVIDWNAASLASSFFGLLTGFGLGVVLFYAGGLGGGDAKLIAALGAVVGLKPLFLVLFYVAIVGGVLSVLAKIRKRRDLAYAPAIAGGYCVYLFRHAT
jgi:prepilin peptidase CpaA